jgi:BirA family biotin operon repressor/biotin-[acetyl-CoA-carboxylase] ligase
LARGVQRVPDGAPPRDPSLDPDYRLIHLEHTGSTNDDAKRMAANGAVEGTIVWADRQTAGRGRRGRRWESPAGNLYCSLVLRPAVPLARAGQVGFAAALGIAETALAVLPEASVHCKWPNDVLIGGRKMAGLLLETEACGDGMVDWLVLGVGINVASHPTNVDFPATSLAAEGGQADVERVLTLFCRQFHLWYRSWCDEGFAPLREAWLRWAAGLGGPITVRLEDRTIEGLFGGLDEEGALLLHSPGREASAQRITAGDVFFPATRTD